MKRLGLLLMACLWLSGCLTSRVINVTVANQSSGAIRNIEVTYPGGSYGISGLNHQARHAYRIKPFYDGEIQISWQDADGKVRKATGPKLHKDDQGRLVILLDELGAHFSPTISAP